MDDSQSSDFLSESTDIFCNSPTDPSVMDTLTYESFIAGTKSAFSSLRSEIKKSTFPAYFSTLLEDCGACITQSLDLISSILLDSEVHTGNLIQYMTNAVCLLQLLSDFIKNIVESVSMSCHSMKNFPTATGCIISSVFTHCKDSESLYGIHLNSVESQLKDLFRTCHELQLTYLMVLEKHFIFDLAEKEEQDILVAALDINLKIGDLVQSLDVKTMAEQWKAYTMICEKYAAALMDKSIYDNCSRILCIMIMNSTSTALESNQEEKLIVRSLKVGSFTLKILLRICNIFKHAIKKDPDQVIELLFHIYLNSDPYLEIILNKSTQFMNLFSSNILSPANCLLIELTLDEKFTNCIFSYDVNKIRNEDKLLGMIFLTLSVIRALVHRSDDQIKIEKQTIINFIYSYLPHCHMWFNVGFKLKSSQYHTYGLYEHILAHTVALVATMDTEEMNALEARMVEAILGTDCYCAMFSTNLWTLLARMSSRSLLLNQVVSLCKMYQKLENISLFFDSPQQIHLSGTISTLFQCMSYEDKTKIYNLYKIHDDRNIGLWTVLKIKNLPKEVQSNAEDIIIGKFKMQFRKMLSNANIQDIDEMIKIMNLASTCRFVSVDAEMESCVMKAWTKACPRNNRHFTETLNKGNLWYYRYVKGLVSLTKAIERVRSDSTNLVKIIHVISNMIQMGCTEIRLLLIKILCKFANCELRDSNKSLIESTFTQTFVELLQDPNPSVRNKLFYEVKNHTDDNLHRIISKVINVDDSLRSIWLQFTKYETVNGNSTIDIKQHLQAVTDYKYCHKCIENGVSNVASSQPEPLRKSTSKNFDLADLDTLFEVENEEPANKKAKINTDSVVDEIISRLEADATSLCKIKENMTSEYVKRIRKICNKLANLLE